MSFALEESGLIPAVVRRIAVEQIELAQSHLGTASGDLNEAVHATRQCLKRLRALVALVRGELGGKVFEREWNGYRSGGRLLAGGRDAAVGVETFDALIRRYADEFDPEAFTAERAFLEQRRDARLKIMVEEGALQKVAELLAAARDRVDGWPLKHSGFKALGDGLRRSYGAGRQGLRRVIRHPNPTNFHDWRRPAKLLWHQLQIITPIWPPVLNAHAGELRNLSDWLNENHDLDALRQPALWAEFATPPRDPQALIALVDRRCRDLEAQAVPLGERLYGERRRWFCARLERYWQAWEHAEQNAAMIVGATETMAAAAAAAAAQPVLRTSPEHA